MLEPISKKLPDFGVHTGPYVTAVSSVAIGVLYSTTAPFAVVASTVIMFGCVIFGAVESPVAIELITVTSNVFVPVFPAESVTEQVTLVVPTGKKEPE